MFRVALGLLLLGAAVLKGHQLMTSAVISTEFWDVRWVRALEVLVEAALGLWLVSGFAPVYAGRLTCLCFIGFAGITLYKGLMGATSCGCFGNLQVNPWSTFVLDLTAIPMALWVGLGDKNHPPAHQGLRLKVAATVFVLAGVPAFAKMMLNPPAEDRQLVVVDPAQWVGRPWPLTPYVDIGPQISKGRWAVLLFSWSCKHHCSKAVLDYADLATQWRQGGAEPRVALVEMYGDPPPEGMARELAGSPALRGRLRENELLLSSPTLVMLVDGHVVAVAQGEVSCRWDEEKDARWVQSASAGPGPR